uniref:Exocyst subunit Exo70 family protein n=1 Tax=Kalanchoe fedtschenkoi TaxID=63787 RepID=A0A7N0UK07_KALFE
MKKGGMRSIFFKAASPLSSRASSPLPGYATGSSSPYAVHHHTFSESIMEENINNAEFIVSSWEAQAESHLNTPFISMFTGDRADAKAYLKCVRSLQAAMKFFAAESSSSEHLVRAHKLMQQAMNRLEKELYHILKSNRDSLDPESVSTHSSRTSTARSSISEDTSDDEFEKPAESVVSEGSDLAPNLAMSDLRAIADAMISSGYAKECIKIYRITRKSIIDEGVYHLGVERLTFANIQKLDWETMEFRIRKWLHAIRAAVKVLFYGERVLCDHVFHSSNSIREACFTEISKEAALTLFSFPEMVAKTKKSPEKMFRILDMYESIAELWQEIESVFSYDLSAPVRTQAVNSLVRLGDSIRSMLTEFEANIQKDTSRTSVPGGGVHPLTRYVMNYISFLADYSNVLADIVADFPINVASLPETYIESLELDDSPTSAISGRLAWLILVLLCKLDGKAGFYKDVALSYLFLANNLQYVIVKVRRSNLRYLLGEDWIAKHDAKVKLYAANYQRVGWSKVFAALPANPTSDIVPQRARNCFKNFNAAFEEAYRKQTSWSVPDSKLRDETKISISTALLPTYRAFYESYQQTARRTGDGVLGGDQVVRYTPDDLGNYLSDLFYGTGSYGSTTSSAATSPSGSSTSGGRYFR